MNLSTFELLHDIGIKGKLFNKNNYIILSGAVFPFFFLKFLKVILSEQYLIKEWINFDLETMNQDVFDSLFYDNFANYQEIQTVLDYNLSFGFIVEIREKSDISLIKKIIQNSKKKNYYIFYLSNLLQYNLKDYSYYVIDDIISEDKKIILIDFLRNNTKLEFFSEIDYIFKYFYKKIEKYIHLEFIFNLFKYITNVKKNNLGEFIDSYIISSDHLLLSCSIFDISTYFFQKKMNMFFEKWKVIKNNYSMEFWLYFWQDQLWYAQLALLNKNNIQDIIFYKKVNRWFLKTGINCYLKNDLLNASLRLYRLDYLYKKFQTNIDLDLESFFFIWFYNK